VNAVLTLCTDSAAGSKVLIDSPLQQLLVQHTMLQAEWLLRVLLESLVAHPLQQRQLQWGRRPVLRVSCASAVPRSGSHCKDDHAGISESASLDAIRHSPHVLRAIQMSVNMFFSMNQLGPPVSYHHSTCQAYPYDQHG
jgi:hypothetical protein